MAFTNQSAWYSFCIFMIQSLAQATKADPQLFQKAVSLNNTDTCAMNTPSEVFEIVSDHIDSVCIPTSVQCAWSCTREPMCTSYNYMTIVQECELYYYEPTNFTCISDSSCIYFLVRLL